MFSCLQIALMTSLSNAILGNAICPFSLQGHNFLKIPLQDFVKASPYHPSLHLSHLSPDVLNWQFRHTPLVVLQMFELLLQLHL